MQQVPPVERGWTADDSTNDEHGEFGAGGHADCRRLLLFPAPAPRRHCPLFVPELELGFVLILILILVLVLGFGFVFALDFRRGRRPRTKWRIDPGAFDHTRDHEYEYESEFLLANPRLTRFAGLV
jgi:hypothetical protein